MTYYDSNGNEYTVTDGVLYVTKGASGTGEMGDFSYDSNLRTTIGITESFTSAILDNTIHTVGRWAFLNDTELVHIQMSDSITLSQAVFQGCTSLELTSLPSGLTSIENQTFQGCTSLELTSLPSGLTSIGNQAFFGCAFTSMTIPKNVVNLTGFCFYNCSALTAVIMQSATPCTIGGYVFPTTTTIYVPFGTGDAYKSAWSAYADQIVESPAPGGKADIVMQIITGFPTEF